MRISTGSGRARMRWSKIERGVGQRSLGGIARRTSAADLGRVSEKDATHGTLGGPTPTFKHSSTFTINKFT